MRNIICGDQEILLVTLWLVPRRVKTEDISYWSLGSYVSLTCFRGVLVYYHFHLHPPPPPPPPPPLLQKPPQQKQTSSFTFLTIFPRPFTELLPSFHKSLETWLYESTCIYFVEYIFDSTFTLYIFYYDDICPQRNLQF